MKVKDNKVMAALKKAGKYLWDLIKAPFKCLNSLSSCFGGCIDTVASAIVPHENIILYEEEKDENGETVMSAKLNITAAAIAYAVVWVIIWALLNYWTAMAGIAFADAAVRSFNWVVSFIKGMLVI